MAMAAGASLELYQLPAEILPGILRLVIQFCQWLLVLRLLAEDQGEVDDQEHGSVPNGVLVHVVDNIIVFRRYED